MVTAGVTVKIAGFDVPLPNALVAIALYLLPFKPATFEIVSVAVVALV